MENTTLLKRKKRVKRSINVSFINNNSLDNVISSLKNIVIETANSYSVNPDDISLSFCGFEDSVELYLEFQSEETDAELADRMLTKKAATAIMEAYKSNPDKEEWTVVIPYDANEQDAVYRASALLSVSFGVTEVYQSLGDTDVKRVNFIELPF